MSDVALVSVDNDEPGLYIGNAIINIDDVSSKIGYALLWGDQKLQMILGVVPTDGKIKLIGINENAVIDKEVSEVVAVFSKYNKNAMDPVLIGKATKCYDGSIDVQLFGTPFPNTKIIVR